MSIRLVCLLFFCSQVPSVFASTLIEAKKYQSFAFCYELLKSRVDDDLGRIGFILNNLEEADSISGHQYYKEFASSVDTDSVSVAFRILERNNPFFVRVMISKGISFAMEKHAFICSFKSRFEASEFRENMAISGKSLATDGQEMDKYWGEELSEQCYQNNLVEIEEILTENYADSGLIAF